MEEMLSLEGRIAIVTGGSQGIGRASALALAKAGAKVAISGRRAEKLDPVAEEIKALGSDALKFAMDVSNADAVQAMVAQTIAQWGKIDILVNNAGITKDTLVMRMKNDDWSNVIKTNLDGAFYCTRAVLPSMVKQRFGRIINLSSIVAQSGNAGQANYIASKSGIIGLTKAVAAEVARRNITVNAIAPGFIDTAMTSGLPAELKEKMLGAIPMGRMGTDAEVAHGVVFLALPETSYITGHVLNINGGMFMA
jgi:3-oxoacyl-[acyl-carrier protein] reductase